MMILCSPTKTMRKTKENGKSEPLFHKTCDELIKVLKTYDQQKFKQVLHINDKLAAACVDMYAQMQEDNLAIAAFNGLQFKQLAWDDLNEDDKNYAFDHIGILSGLYGLLRASDNIGLYRLDYDDIIDGKKIIDYHRKQVNEFLSRLTLPLINLCSQEYAQIIEVDQLRVEFLEADLKAKATSSKIQRGKMMHYCIVHKIEDPELLKTYHEDGYRYCDKLSDNKRWIFVKGGDINEGTGKSL